MKPTSIRKRDQCSLRCTGEGSLYSTSPAPQVWMIGLSSVWLNVMHGSYLGQSRTQLLKSVLMACSHTPRVHYIRAPRPRSIVCLGCSGNPIGKRPPVRAWKLRTMHHLIILWRFSPSLLVKLPRSDECKFVEPDKKFQQSWCVSNDARFFCTGNQGHSRRSLINVIS